jgi:hypothetical protein
MFQLSHGSEDCPGRWQRVVARGGTGWCCPRCGAAYHDGVAVRFAVLRDHDLELAIVRLVREGRRLLAAPREPEG